MSRFLTVRWRLATAFFLVILILLSTTGLYLLTWTERYYVTATSEYLRREGLAVAGFIQSASGDITASIRRTGGDLGRRITVVLPDGVVIADSEKDFRKIPNHSDRPEVVQALATGYGTSTRYSATLKARMLYIAVSYGPRKKPLGVVRVAEPLSGLDHIMTAIQATFFFAGLVAVIAAAILSLRLASSITRPIESIASAAGKLEEGDLGARAPEKPRAPGELGALASAFNSMAEKLQSNVDEINQQSAQMQAVFDLSDNGLVLIDSGAKIRMINPAACRMLGVNGPGVVWKTLIEGTLSHDLAGLVERVRRTREPAALDLDLPAKETRSVHAYVAPVPRPEGGMDVLVVLHDVTAMRKLDAVRQDFVANVSHELRTPLASIKAMAETIVLRHKASPAAVQDFATSIVQEADRMTQLAEDLLDLTRIESERAETVAEPVVLRTLVDDVFGRLSGAASRKSIALVCEVAEDDVIQASPAPLGQVLFNLVDNAIKYTADGGTVRVSMERLRNRIAIRVTDNGIGIPAQDQPRIFERFYRVDKDRSRQSGGTGLGLAIVKHLCEQMGGSVSLKSKVGKGSTFSVILPAGED